MSLDSESHYVPEVFKIEPLPPEDVAKALRATAGLARDADDLAMLIDMLGFNDRPMRSTDKYRGLVGAGFEGEPTDYREVIRKYAQLPKESDRDY